MEDILDTFLVEVAAPAETEKKDGWLKRLEKNIAELIKKSKARHTIAGAIEDMKKRLQEVADRRDRFSVPVALPAPATKPDPRLADMHKEVEELIGIDKAKAELRAMLLPTPHGHGDSDASGSSSRGKMQIVSVVGVGGLGKTTLAKAVYDELQPRYDCGAFVSVGRNADLLQVFTNIIFHLDRKEYESIREVRSLQLLVGGLRKLLNKRYLIFQKLRCCLLFGWMVRLVPSEDSRSVSFTIWKGKQGGMAFVGSKTEDVYSTSVAPPRVMPDLQELSFSVPVRDLYKDGNGGCDNLGLECLPSLRSVEVSVDCEGASADDMEKAVAELKVVEELHPNRPIIRIFRRNKENMTGQQSTDQEPDQQEDNGSLAGDEVALTASRDDGPATPSC